MKAKDVQAFFERVASDRDSMRLAYCDERVIERITDVSNLRESMTVADVGTGTGLVAAGVAPRVVRKLRSNRAAPYALSRYTLINGLCLWY